MEKNTAITIGLSTVILVAFFAIQTFFFPQKKNSEPQKKPAEKATVETKVENNAEQLPEQNLFAAESASEQNVSLSEENFVIETNVAKVTFSNRGGDIISYELKEHNDRDTGKGVEMCANVTPSNRAFAISLGSNNSVINELFTAKIIDDKTIGFFKDFSVRKADGTLGNFTLVKTYSFKDDEYLFKLDITIDGGENFSGLDVNGNAYSLRTAPQIGPAFNPKDRYDIREIVAYDGDKKFNPKSGKERNFKWISVAGKYFEILVNPADNVETSGLVKIISPDKRGNIKDSQVIITRSGVSGQRISDSYNIYVGPRSEKEIKKYNLAEKNAWGISGTHYGESLPTSGILSWLEYILKFIMELIYKVIPNWGVSIIILTILLKLALFPLTKKSLEGTQKMSKVQPKMKEIQDKYKSDPQKMQQETAKLYKEIGYNPMSGCLPLVFQFVILWSMYHLFNNYFEFRGASFIPGWINDLSSTDNVCTFGFSIPWLGNELHILPIIYLISQLLFGKITQNGGTSVGQSGGQMKMMMYGMPILFFFLFYSAPSGLLLYWTVSNIFQLGQQLFINYRMKNKPVVVNKSQKTITKSKKR
ncbi:MAG: membrane protein insertase YidC [Treponema sp.]|nr:membrane protein insertase YidC [Treponema sp.]